MTSFSELPLSASILRAVAELGFETPSPIQAETLPLLLGEPTDFLGLAATGTGKTAAFGLPMLEKIDADLKAIQCLILCPTRELALQVSGQISLLGKYKGIKAVTVYGGASYADQIRGIKMGAQVCVGTPGRVVDHINRGTLKLDKVQVVILDEADEMISMGFKEDLEVVLKAVSESQIWLFSATMSREVRKVADAYLRNPKQVQVNRKEMLPSTVEQFYYPTREGDKPEILCKLIEAAEDFYGLIFCQTKALVVELTQHLGEKGYKVDCLHGDKDQNARERTMQSFRDRKVRILVCTDVASRGLDVKDITHVINYSLPRELDNYVHRIGRTARSGKTGIAMNLVTASHRRLIYDIEKLTKTQMLEGKIPTRREIGAKKVAKMLTGFNDQPFYSRVSEVMGEDWKTALASMNSEEVASRFLAMIMPEVFGEREKKAAFGAEMKTDSPRRSAAPPRDRRERERREPREHREPSEARPQAAAKPRAQGFSTPSAGTSAARVSGLGSGLSSGPALSSAAGPVRKARFSSEIRAAKGRAPLRTSAAKAAAKPRLREVAKQDPYRNMDSVEKSLSRGPSRKERRAVKFENHGLK